MDHDYKMVFIGPFAFGYRVRKHREVSVTVYRNRQGLFRRLVTSAMLVLRRRIPAKYSGPLALFLDIRDLRRDSHKGPHCPPPVQHAESAVVAVPLSDVAAEVPQEGGLETQWRPDVLNLRTVFMTQEGIIHQNDERIRVLEQDIARLQESCEALVTAMINKHDVFEDEKKRLIDVHDQQIEALKDDKEKIIAEHQRVMGANHRLVRDDNTRITRLISRER